MTRFLPFRHLVHGVRERFSVVVDDLSHFFSPLARRFSKSVIIASLLATPGMSASSSETITGVL